MFCPKCKSSDTSVRKSEKITGREARVHRTRRCNSCRYQFQTTETPNVASVEEEAPKYVQAIPEPAPEPEKKVSKPRAKKAKPEETPSEDSDK